MKIPQIPPDYQKELAGLIKTDPGKTIQLLADTKPVDQKNRYLHWDELRHRTPPEGITSEQWWALIKSARLKTYREITHIWDKNKKPFTYSQPDALECDLHWLAQNAGSNVYANQSLFNSNLKRTYLIRSLFNEAINSSQIEGAATTKKVAKEMLREGRDPKDKSEQMIYNNYHAMQFIRDQKEEPLTPSVIFELHTILTQNTLENPEKAGQFRLKDDNVFVVDSLDNKELFVPPPSVELPGRLKRLCDFANEDDPKQFINPLVKAIILHFTLAYDHPFVDGNGRTARALFYWYAAKRGYELIEYISISEILKDEPGKYKKAYLFTETDGNDLTYFINYQIEVIKKCLDLLFSFLEKENREIRKAKRQLDEKIKLEKIFNYRQIAILKHAVDNPGYLYTVYGHKNTHGVTYQTARSDLLVMADKYKLFDKSKFERTWIFKVPTDFRKRMKNIK